MSEGGEQPDRAQDVEQRLLGDPRELRRREVSAQAGVSLQSARRFWRALGFPNVDDDMVAFTPADQHSLEQVAALVRDGMLDDATAIAMTRAVGRSTDRLASWQVQLLAEAVAAHVVGSRAAPAPAPSPAGDGPEAGDAEAAPASPAPDPRHATQVADLVVELADRLEPLINYAWRRHLAAAVARLLADAEPADERRGGVRTVGFADLVAFTRVVRRLSERDLARLVQRFEALASDVVAAHGGRVVKTVGDEVLFAVAGPAAGAAIALDVAAAMAEDDVLPDVRVGLATGPVVMRLGDVFGTTVNRASRLTGVARPGGVLVDDTTAAALASISGFELVSLTPRPLRGLGSVRPWSLRRADPTTGRRLVAPGPLAPPDDLAAPDALAPPAALAPPDDRISAPDVPFFG